MVVPCSANDRTVSRDGIGVLPPSSRVSTTDCATSGIVSSRCTIAATALKLLTPGITSVSRPSAVHSSCCSCVPPHSAGSPEWMRATSRSSRAARS